MARISKKDESSLKRCRNRVATAKKFRQQEGLDDLWERLIDMYRGKQFPAGISDQDKVAVNIAFSTINVIGPSVAVNNPKVLVLAREPEDDDRAVILEQVVNYWWKHYELQDEFRRAVDDFLILGFGWLKTGYRYVEEEVPLAPDELEAEFEERVSEADAYAQENPELAGDLPTDEEIQANLVGTKTAVAEDRPFMERVDPTEVYVDPEATSLRDARWIAQKITKTLEEVCSDERYDTSVRRSVAADGRVSDEWRPSEVSDKDQDFQRVTVWEFYDLKQGTMCVFSELGDGFLVKPTQQPYAFGHPFVMLRNYDVPGHFYPMGELEAIEPLQQELNAHRTALLNDRKQNQRKYLYDPKAFDKHGVAGLKSDRDNEMVPVTGTVPLPEAVLPFPRIPLDPQLYQNSEMILSDVTLVSGVNEYARGALPEIRRTATEASIIQDAANSRAADKLAKVEKIIGRCAQRLVALAQQYMTEDTTVRIVGRNGLPLWVHVDPDDIKGEFDFDVEGGSTQPKNEQARRREATELMTALAPLAPMGVVNLPELLRHFLKEGFGIKQPDRFLMDGPSVTQGLGGEPPLMDGPPGSGDEPNPNMPTPPEGGMPPELSAVQGVPPEALTQLEGQVGLSVGV